MALVAWPDRLPPPLASGYGYQPQAPFIRTNMDSGLARQRRRFARIPSTVSVSWIFTQEQLALFEAFVHYDITDGADWFSAQLANGQELQSVRARMIGAPKVDVIEPGIWHVSVQMETVDMPMATVDEYVVLRDFGADVFHAQVGSLHTLTDINSFAEVQYEIIPPGGAMTLFPDNVVTADAVGGLELKGANESGAGWVGPFVANPAATQANYIGIDINLPQGLFSADNDGNPQAAAVTYQIQAQLIDDTGVAIGAWFDLAQPTISLATMQPQMLSDRYLVPAGRYQIRAQRVGNKDLGSRVANTVQWAGLRAYLPSQHYYGNVTLLAMVIRATNNLNSQTARKVNVIATRKLPVWNGAAWSAPVATRNPAWALADVLRNSDYGRGLPDSRINLGSLQALASIWDSRGDRFDGVFDTAATLWDALSQIANVGDAMPVYYAGVIDFVRDDAKSIRTAMFTPNNIVAGSLSIEYLFPNYDTPDHVIVEYVDGTTFQAAEVPCVLSGGTQLRPSRLKMFGCTDRNQAWRHGMRLAAANRDRRRNITLVTEMEGYIPRYGDLVAVSHDVPAWGLSGVVLGYAGGVVTTSEPLTWTPGQTHFMAFRKRDGSVDGPYTVTQGTDEFSAVIAGAPSIYVSDGASEEPTHYQFGPGQRRGLDCQVLGAFPKGDGQVEMTLVNYAASVQEAETGGSAPPPPPASLLPGISDAPVVASVTVSGSPKNGTSVISCAAARGAASYEFQASSDGGATWVALGSSGSNSITANLGAGSWKVRARAIGTMQGPWAIWSGSIAVETFPPGAPTLTLQNPPFTGGSMRVNISDAKGDFRHVKVITSGVVRYEGCGVPRHHRGRPRKPTRPSQGFGNGRPRRGNGKKQAR